MMMIDALRREFFRARDEADAKSIRDHGPPPGVPPNTCRYCGAYWRLYVGSTLDGHAKCIVPDWFKRELIELFARTPALTYRLVAETIGVTSAVVRSWVAPISSRSAAATTAADQPTT
jgi:hypothetical protein